MLFHLVHLLVKLKRHRHAPSNPRRTAAVFGLVALGIGGVGGYNVWQDYRVRRVFLPIEVKIMHNNVALGESRHGKKYYADVGFTYRVGGVNYGGGKYELLRSSSRARSEIDAIVRRYPTGSTQTAYYDPGEPSVAVLSRDVSWRWLLFLSLGGGIPGLIAISSLFRILWLRRGIERGYAARRRANESAGEDHRESDEFNAPPPNR